VAIPAAHEGGEPAREGEQDHEALTEAAWLDDLSEPALEMTFGEQMRVAFAAPSRPTLPGDLSPGTLRALYRRVFGGEPPVEQEGLGYNFRQHVEEGAPVSDGVARTVRPVGGKRPVTDAQLAGLDFVGVEMIREAVLDLMYEQEGLELLREPDRCCDDFNFDFTARR
jgi:hypothetical protein